MAGCTSNPLAAVGTQLVIFMHFVVQPLGFRELGLFLGKHFREPLAFRQVRFFGHEIAEMLGTTAGTVSVEISTLRKQGVLRGRKS